MPSGLENTLTSIGSCGSRTAFTDFLTAVGGSLAGLEREMRSSGRCVDVSDLHVDELRDRMGTISPDVGQEVLAVWPFDHVAATVRYRDLLERIDDLWYPGTDDLVIIDDGQDARRAILLDHEERLFAALLILDLPS